jgi:hypothetical protein
VPVGVTEVDTGVASLRNEPGDEVEIRAVAE